MFTGIVQALGAVAGREERGGDLRLKIDVQALAQRVDATRLAVGQSIAVSGTCLTVVAMQDGVFTADVSRETLAHTTLGELNAGAVVNLEAALRMGDPLGGHLVSGHVDGVARVESIAGDARSQRLLIGVPDALARFIAPKGTVALDGVSLTVNEVDGTRFGVNLIPETLTATTLGRLAAGQRLNLEVDPLARYVLRALGR